MRSTIVFQFPLPIFVHAIGIVLLWTESDYKALRGYLGSLGMMIFLRVQGPWRRYIHTYNKYNICFWPPRTYVRGLVTSQT